MKFYHLLKRPLHCITRYTLTIRPPPRLFYNTEKPAKKDSQEELSELIRKEMGSLYDKIQSGAKLSREEELEFTMVFNRVVHNYTKKQKEQIKAAQDRKEKKLPPGMYSHERSGQHSEEEEKVELPDYVVMKRDPSTLPVSHLFF
jgi:hypothetical protein